MVLGIKSVGWRGGVWVVELATHWAAVLVWDWASMSEEPRGEQSACHLATMKVRQRV